MRFVDFHTFAPIDAALIKACSADDLACATPYASTSTNSDGSGTLVIPLNPRAGFDAYPGFIEHTRAGSLPGLIFFTPPAVTDSNFGVPVFSGTTIQELAQAGATIDNTRGIIVFSALDCGARKAVGISVRVNNGDAATRTFYSRSASAGGSIYDFAATATTEEATGAILNVPPGQVEVTMSIDGLCLVTGRVTVGVRAGTVTNLTLPPLPSVP